ncbi:MAG: ComEC family competence protein [Desulfobacteraceae bacterium]|nr:ComEC family competence protein [Desulfobacteraceae bacterium]
MEKIYSRPLIPLLISFMAGIAAGYLLPCYAPLLYPAKGFSVLVVLAVIFRQGMARFSPLVLFLCLGYFSIQLWVAPDFPENHVTRYMDQREWEITGEIFQPPIAPAKNRAQFYLEIHSLASGPARPFPVCGRIRITALNPSFDPVQGDRVRLRSKIRSFRNFLNPGAYDYKTHMAFKDISGSAFVSGEDLLCLRPAPEKGTPFRQKIKTLMEEAVKGPSREVLAALILGESTGIDPALRETINRSGLSHLLAISGLHIGIVASAAFFIFRYLLSFSPFLIRHAWTKKIAALAALGPILFYGWFSGMSPSTQRAVIMVATFMMTFLFERDQDIYNTLALAALVILIVHPPSLFMVSFQLSFAAVFAIVFGMSRLPTLAGPDSSVAVKWGSHLFSFLAVSFFAFLGTLPLVMFYFNQVSLIGMVSNLAGIPLIGFLAVPLGLISTAAGFFSHEAAYAGFWLCGRLLDVSLGIVSYLASFEFSAVKTITPSFLEIACFYILIFGVFQVKKYQAARILVVITFMVMTLDVTYWVHRR